MKKKKTKLLPRKGPPTNTRAQGAHEDKKVKYEEKERKKMTEQEINDLWTQLERNGLC